LPEGKPQVEDANQVADANQEYMCTTLATVMSSSLDRIFSSRVKSRDAKIFAEKISTNRKVLCYYAALSKLI